jgi:NAD(P)-dependent dehydrogenase (short-subunit alcohol dehydrogenase family)
MEPGGHTVSTRFAGRAALVTGAATGIGQATALRLAAEGALVGVGRHPMQSAEETLAGIRAAGGAALDLPCDMRDPNAVTAMVADFSRRAGRLDHVVSNAAINPDLPWDQTSFEDFDRLFETNVRGSWVVATEGAKLMPGGGSIVFVSSISAHVGAPNQVAYCGTKGAISMLAKALGAVLGARGIRVNAVEPGPIATPMSAGLFTDERALAFYTDRVALHRIGQPAELAATIAFLLSDEASYVTSATLLVDGGFIVNAEI